MILLLVIGCIAVVFGVYWARRAVNATPEPVVTLKESASLTDTVRRLYALETTPDDCRMSSSQRDYIRTNLDEFVSLHRDEMETMVDDALERFRANTSWPIVSRKRGARFEASLRLPIRKLCRSDTHYAIASQI
jgi:hypothetical protein